ncbi:MAG: class I SAM-dependent methyltransferase [Anaerolineae bacterium]
MSAWYETSFGLDYLRLYPHRDLAEARANVAAMLAWLPLPSDQPLLDLACGACRVLVSLSERSFTRLVGLDLSLDLLRVGAQALREAGVPEVCLYAADRPERPEPDSDRVVLVQGDMRQIPYEGYFATVLSIFTSFGYFPTDAENEQVLAGVARALRPEGLFVLDYLNRERVAGHLVPSDEQRRPDGSVVRNHRAITADGLRVEKTTEVAGTDGERRVFHESVRMYTPAEVGAMLQRAGLAETQHRGNFAGDAFGPGSERLIVVAAKRGSR